MANIEGYIPIQSPLMPNNDNPRSWVSDIKYIKGGGQVFSTIDELVAFHPFRMKAGMVATILNYPGVGVITDFRLGVEPSSMVNSAKNSVVTLDNFLDFWVIQSQTSAPTTRVYQYAADSPGGGMPTFPYTEAHEPDWSGIRDDSRGHRWVRFRDDDVDSNADGIYDNWTPPLPIGEQFRTGDYEENRFKRQAVDTTPRTSTAGLIAGKYYIIETGTITITGDVEANEIGEYGDTTTAVITPGKVFKYVAGNGYTFNPATVQEVVSVPPKAIGGVLNNEPVGWGDTIPLGSAQLWQISAQKSVYGQLKSSWILKKIVEDPDFIRYSNSPSPHPSTLAGRNDAVVSGGATDLALIAAGWESVYNSHNFIATRALDPDPSFLYTEWVVEKINEESGEYQDRVFKLFDLNLDSDSPSVAAPTQRDPTKEGWSDAPLQETDTQINFVSEARKFFNGELKTAWSIPVPYTGKDVFNDAIDTTQDNFHYAADGTTVDPSLITLTAKLWKGTSALWENPDLIITYAWERVYNDGDPDTTIGTTDNTLPFYIKSSDAPYRPGQRLFVKPTAVDGTAIFRCTQTFTISTGNELEFEEEISLLDITDGKDAKSFDIKADNQLVVYDTTASAYSLANIIIRAYWANLIGVSLRWFKKTGLTWTLLSGSPYTIGGNTLSFTPASIFAEDGTSEEATYACTTHPTELNPENVDYDQYFTDITTIVKLGSLAVGAPGADAVAVLLENESHTIVLDKTTGLPQTGEAAKATTKVRLYSGTTEKLYGTDWTASIASDNVNVTFTLADGGDYANVTVNTWGANQLSAVCTITMTFAGKTYVKKFSVSSTKDAPGAILLDIDSNKGYIFSPLDRTDKIITGILYDGQTAVTLPNGALYEFRFKVAGTFGSWGSANTKTVTRANILITGDVVCEVRRTGELTAFAARTIKVTDVLDGKTYRAFTQNVAQPTTGRYLTNQNPTTVFGVSPGYVTGVALGTTPTITWYVQASSFWTTNPNTQIWEQEAEEYVDTDNVAKWRWSTPKQIKGEVGDQGPQGNFVFPMYRALVPVDPTNPNDPAYTTPPPLGNSNSNVATLAQMKTASWLSKLPVGTTAVIWKTERMWNGEGVTFDTNGDPSTTPVSAASPWLPPTRISSKDGAPGTIGNTGLNGWSPLFSINNESATRKTLKLVGWTGGTGALPSPSHIGEFLGTSGFVTTSAAAQNIQGDAVEIRQSAGFLQWKYITEGSTAWRNIMQLEFTGNIVYAGADGGSSSSAVRSIGVDLGTTTLARNLLAEGWLGTLDDLDFVMEIWTNSTNSLTGATMVARYNYKTASAGVVSRQYQIIHNFISSARWILLKCTALGGGGIRAGNFGIKVTKI